MTPCMGNGCSPGCLLWCLILCCPFSHEMSLMRSGTDLSQFLRIFLHTLKKTNSSTLVISAAGVVCIFSRQSYLFFFLTLSGSRLDVD